MSKKEIINYLEKLSLATLILVLIGFAASLPTFILIRSYFLVLWLLFIPIFVMKIIIAVKLSQLTRDYKVRTLTPSFVLIIVSFFVGFLGLDILFVIAYFLMNKEFKQLKNSVSIDFTNSFENNEQQNVDNSQAEIQE
ncbi:hypothetical protein [Mycoplasmopsis gallopavonis]|uniref:Uncharacterized protein n=1 Tax=Mycoplasmopsis gallopavonis TaxID=76629 RepID=A0A449AYX0_9BACT|nr:hypothetical protein [Mycoplasmopsis gallopavonis]RIV16485.1 hypothetical protein D1113_02160 [Mycoplasmopsis gallopavonis]VEU72682.1 Uncharacterised protein [Mycoplasmopsis gallopavonis]